MALWSRGQVGASDETNAGSLVARGRAKGVVVAIGTATGVGQLALDVMGSGGGKSPLLERMERFTNYVAVGTLAAAGVIGLLGILLGGYTLVETFFFVVALAVAAIHVPLRRNRLPTAGFLLGTSIFVVSTKIPQSVRSPAKNGPDYRPFCANSINRRSIAAPISHSVNLT